MAGIITALRTQKSNKERVSVYLDGRFALGLPAIVAATLKKGQHLSDQDLARLKALDEEEKAYERSLRFLGYRPRSIAEVRRYLQKHDLSEAVIETVLRRLSGAGYLDDEAFAGYWIADRERFRPRGHLALRHELRQKGVANEIIDRALQSVEAESSAYRAGADRARRLKHLDQKAFRQKLGGFLLRRGFTHAVVWPVVDQLWQELAGESDDDRSIDWE